MTWRNQETSNSRTSEISVFILYNLHTRKTNPNHFANDKNYKGYANATHWVLCEDSAYMPSAHATCQLVSMQQQIKAIFYKKNKLASLVNYNNTG